MKRGLLTFLVPFMFLTSGCEKERSLGNCYDLDGDGIKEEVFEIPTYPGAMLVYLKGNLDTFYIRKFKTSPINPGFFDFENDGFPDLNYGVYEKGKFKLLRVDNIKGKFEEGAKELYGND